MEECIHVLLVDDDEDEYALTRDQLAEAVGVGFDLAWEATYEAALETMVQARYDVYLVDYHLDEQDGLELLCEAIARGCTAPIILLTGQGDHEIDLAAMQAGAADYLDKSQINAQLLERSIRYAVERKRIEGALKESEERYRTLLDDVIDISTVGIFILDRDFGVVWVNRALERFFGLQRDRVIGQDKRQLIREQIKDRCEDPATFAETVLATYDDNTYVENFECHILPDDEREERWLEHWSQPIRSGLYAGGRVELYYDITERKRAEEELSKHREHLEELIDERTAELRKLLNLMSGREVRMADLKRVIRKLRTQLEEAGLEPVADDPFLDREE